MHCDWEVNEPGRSVTVLPPWPAPEYCPGPRRRGGLPLPWGAGWSGWVEWNYSRSVGSRMSFIYNILLSISIAISMAVGRPLRGNRRQYLAVVDKVHRSST